MKIPVPVICSACGTEFSAFGVGEERIPPATCPKCGAQIHILDPLSVSVIADRLLYRSKHELDEGDYTLSIICSAIAVETAFTQVFIKWKSIEYLNETGNTASETEVDAWEDEYRKQTRGSFERSANLVAQYLVGKTFDEFVTDFLARSNVVALIKVGFPQYESQANLNHIYVELFRRRNRIMHWGRMDYQLDDAKIALQAGRTAFAILQVMDRERYEAMERAWRAKAQ